MTWSPPQLPDSSDRGALIRYWRSIIDIPSTEASADILQEIARVRLARLGVGAARSIQRQQRYVVGQGR